MTKKEQGGEIEKKVKTTKSLTTNNMKNYLVESSETVIYYTKVEASSPKEARELVEDGHVDVGKPVDSTGWEVTSVEDGDTK